MCLCIGNFGDMLFDQWCLLIWFKFDDFVQFCCIGFEYFDIYFEVFYGVLFNECVWWDNYCVYEFGYCFIGCVEDFCEYVMVEQVKLKLDLVGDYFQGGMFCSLEFDVDLSWIIDWSKC